MKSRSRLVSLTILGAMVLGADYAAGALTIGSTPIVITCLAPTTAQCTDPTFIKNAEGSFCASSWKSSCAAQLNTLANSSTPVAGRRFDDAGTPKKAKIMTTPSVVNLKNGTAASFAPKSFNADLSTWAGWEAKATWDASQGAPITDKNGYVRYPGWEANGTFLTSCQKYVYDSFYDIERWRDSVNACRGDEKCIVNVSFAPTGSAPPRIAPVAGVAGPKVLKDKSGGKIADRIAVLRANQQIDQWAADPFSPNDMLADAPKNAFYGGTETMFVPALIAAFNSVGKGAEVQALLNELHRGGQNYYQMYGSTTVGGAWVPGTSQMQQGFRDEWEFHEVMNQRTQFAPDGSLMTDDDFAEYQARNKRIERAMDLAYHQLKCSDINLPTDCNELPNAVGHVNPGDEVIREEDDLLMRGIYAHVDPMKVFVTPSMTVAGQLSLSSGLSTLGLSGLDVAFLPLPGTKTTALSHQGTWGSSGSRTALSATHLPGLVSASYAAIPRVAPTSDVVIPTPVFSLGGYLQAMWTASPPKIDTTASYPRLDCGPSALTGPSTITMRSSTETRTMTTAYKAFCDAANVVLDEWGKKLQGKPSCVDRTGYYCDWSPDLFVKRYVSKHMSLAAAAKEAEFSYCKDWTGGGNFFSADPNVGVPSGNRDDVAELRTFIDARRQKFLDLTKNVPVRGNDDFGTDKSDGRSIGGDFLGGEYNYKFGWDAKIDRLPDGTNRICRMSGKVYGQFHAGANVIGSHFDVVDAGMSLSVNDGWSGKAKAFAQLEIMNYALLPDDFGTFGPNGEMVGGHEFALNSVFGQPVGEEDDYHLIDVPFQVGWFTVTLSAGGGYSVGIMNTFQANAAKDCTEANANKPPFSVVASVVPGASVFGTASASVSLLGLVGAGVEGEVTILGIDAPLTGVVQVAPHTKNNVTSYALDFDLGLDLDVHALDGKLKAFVELLGIDIVKVPIVSWDGLHWRNQIFHTPPVSVPIAFLQAPVGPHGPTAL